MKSVVLLGALGEEFGRNHRFDVKSLPEAIRALNANFPKFQNSLMISSDKGVGYRVMLGESWVVDDDELLEPLGNRDSIMIVPAIVGSSGVAKIFLGAALIGVSFIPGVGPITAGYFLATGIGLGLSGVVQLLTPLPQFGAYESADNKPSYIFTGAVNTNSQGQPIPIGYGTCIVGSAVVSAGLSVEVEA